MIGDLINLRIALAVTTNVGQAVRRFWIGPEVRRLGHVIMLISTRRRHRLVDNREWAFRKRLLRLALQLGPGGGESFVAVMKTLSSQLHLLCVKQKYSRHRAAIRLLPVALCECRRRS